jgi:hypothetical protein
MAGIGEADNAFAYANTIQNVRTATQPFCIYVRHPKLFLLLAAATCAGIS